MSYYLTDSQNFHIEPATLLRSKKFQILLGAQRSVDWCAAKIGRLQQSPGGNKLRFVPHHVTSYSSHASSIHNICLSIDDWSR